MDSNFIKINRHQLHSVLFLILFVSGSFSSKLLAAPDDITSEKMVAGKNTEFALNLYSNLREKKGNLFFSPYSISAALAMTYAGARGNTKKQMSEVLHFDADQEKFHPDFSSLLNYIQSLQDEDTIKLEIANSIWLEKSYEVLESFLTTTKKYYNANLFWVDFKTAFNAVRDEINTWVEEKTNNKIKDLIPDNALNKWTRFVLVNAIYFKGTWASQFKKHNTKDASFWPEPEKEITVPMMHKTGYFQYTEDESLQIVELPYKGREVSMLILLPKKDVAMTEVEKSLTTETLNKWISNLSSNYVSISMPKYKVTSKFTLNDNLKSMGVLDAFSKKAADFSGMANLLPDEILYISAVIHKAFVDVNEEGTEAAAATAVVTSMGITSAPPPPKIFNADHPFLFLIRDNATGSILFFGRVVDPTI